MVHRQVARVEIHQSRDIAAPADQVWELIKDWAGMLRWWLSAENGGLPGPALISCELIGEAHQVPRTRRITLEDGYTTEEEVLAQHDDTRRISYRKADDPDIIGYLASTYVDDEGKRGCTVHLSAQFDVLEPTDPAVAEARFQGIYTAMFNGYARYFERAGHRSE